MSCCLHVQSKTSDLTAFADTSSLPVEDTYRRGEMFTGARPGAYPHFGFTCIVSDGKLNDLPGQIADAIGFLREYEAELCAVATRYHEVEITLDFGIQQRVGVTCAAQYDRFPAELIKRAGKVGAAIELSIYPVRDKAPTPST